MLLISLTMTLMLATIAAAEPSFNPINVFAIDILRSSEGGSAPKQPYSEHGYPFEGADDYCEKASKECDVNYNKNGSPGNLAAYHVQKRSGGAKIVHNLVQCPDGYYLKKSEENQEKFEVLQETHKTSGSSGKRRLNDHAGGLNIKDC